jgi:hypothetical protein
VRGCFQRCSDEATVEQQEGKTILTKARYWEDVNLVLKNVFRQTEGLDG